MPCLRPDAAGHAAHFTIMSIPQFCDLHLEVPSSDSSAHEKMRFLGQVMDAPANAAQAVQARSDKPWLDGRRPIIYVEAPPDFEDPNLCEDMMKVIHEDGQDCFWLVDIPLLNQNLLKLRANVVAVATFDPLFYFFGMGLSDERCGGPLVVRIQIEDFEGLTPRPDDWLIVEAFTSDPGYWMNSQGEVFTTKLTSEEIRLAKDLIDEFRPPSCPVFLNDDPVSFHEMPDWI